MLIKYFIWKTFNKRLKKPFNKRSNNIDHKDYC